MLDIRYPIIKEHTNMREGIRPDEYPLRDREWSRRAITYFTERGLDLAYVNLLESLYPTIDGNICFKLMGRASYQKRNFDLHIHSKVFMPRGVKRAGAVYMPELMLGHDELFITEGPADALAIAQENIRAVAVLGTNIPEATIYYIRRHLVLNSNRVYILFDSDAPGMGAAIDLSGELPYSHIISLPYLYKDIASVPRERRKAWLQDWK